MELDTIGASPVGVCCSLGEVVYRLLDLIHSQLGGLSEVGRDVVSAHLVQSDIRGRDGVGVDIVGDLTSSVRQLNDVEGSLSLGGGRHLLEVLEPLGLVAHHDGVSLGLEVDVVTKGVSTQDETELSGKSGKEGTGSQLCVQVGRAGWRTRTTHTTLAPLLVYADELWSWDTSLCGLICIVATQTFSHGCFQRSVRCYKARLGELDGLGEDPNVLGHFGGKSVGHGDNCGWEVQ